MIWKRYRNELMAAGALLFSLMALGYKSAQQNAATEASRHMVQEVATANEVIGLQKVWGGKHIDRKLEAVKKMISPTKIKWTRSGKKVTATLHDLQASEVNKVVTKLLNLPVQIQKLKIVKKDKTYEMEFVCKW